MLVSYWITPPSAEGGRKRGRERGREAVGALPWTSTPSYSSSAMFDFFKVLSSSSTELRSPLLILFVSDTLLKYVNYILRY